MNMADQSKEISIIIPFYNCEDSLPKLLENIALNPYQNFEVLIGDDASTDSTNDKIAHFLEDERFKLIYSNKNIRAGGMRNRLLDLATGEYVVLQDADDFFLQDKFSMQVEYLNKNLEIGAVGTSASLLNENKIYNRILVPEKINFKNIFFQSGIVHASVMIRSELIKETRYHADLDVGEDYYFLTELFFKNIKFRNIQSELYLYNVDPLDLKTRHLSSFKKLLKARWEISRLFTFPLNYFFFMFHATKSIMGAIKAIWILNEKDKDR